MKKGVRRETKNRNERVVNEDGSFHLNAPDSAVVMCTVFILLEHGTPLS
jgi:hypothetical protein